MAVDQTVDNQFNVSGVMRKDLYPEMFELESWYWWHVAKRRNVIALIKKYLDPTIDGTVVDVGCGAGLMVQELAQFGESVGVDASDDALKFCRERGLANLYLAESNNLPLPDNSAKVMTALDLIEHLDDDLGALKEYFRILKSRGLTIISVPALPQMWSYWDDILGHRRRYTTGSLKHVLEEAGFVVKHVSYSNLSILLPTAVVRRIKSHTKHDDSQVASDFVDVPKWANAILTRVLDVERLFLTRTGLPIGLSVIAVGQKP